MSAEQCPRPHDFRGLDDFLATVKWPGFLNVGGTKVYSGSCHGCLEGLTMDSDDQTYSNEEKERRR